MTLDTSHLPISRLRLPNACHIPGTRSSAEHVWLNRISSRAPDRACDATWQRNLPYRYGWFLFLNRFYWEAHEMWEVVWLKTPINSRERFLLQGLIQLANAGLKGKQKNLRAQCRILEIADGLFEEVFIASSSSKDRASLMGVTKRLAESLCKNMQ